MRKVLFAFIFCLMSIGFANNKVSNEILVATESEDFCAGFATSMALQFATPEYGYWSVWFTVYGACTNDQEFL